MNYRNANRSPILFIAGGNDHLAPKAINKANLRKYVGQKAWEEVVPDIAPTQKRAGSQ